MARRRQGLWLGAFCAMAVLALAGLFPIDNPDTFGHLAAGRQIAELGRVPAQDTFSFWKPEPAPWVNYEWLSGVAFYQVYRVAGWDGLILAKLVLLALTGALLVRRGFARQGALGAGLTALLIGAAIPAVRYRLSVRPHIFGMLLSSVYLLGLLRVAEPASDPRARKQAWAWVAGLAVLHVVWVNLHGSHLLGFALTAVAALAHLREGEARTRLLTLLGLQGIASCISPYGPHIVVDAIAHVADPVYRELVEEWQAWSPHHPLWLACAVVLQCVLVAVSARGLPKDAQRTTTLLTCALLAVMAARSVRFIADFVLLSAPLIAEGLAPRIRALAPRAQRALLVSSCAVVAVAAPALALGVPPARSFGLSLDLRSQPAGIGEWLKVELPKARIFATMEDAWYLMWAVPSAQFLVDGRVPFYGPAHMKTMMRAWADPRALDHTLDASGTDVVVLKYAFEPHQRALHALEQRRDFQLVVIEDKHAAFARITKVREALLQREGLRVLEARYDAQLLLSRDADVDAVHRELARLPKQNTHAYRAWTEGMLALRPLARDEGRAGFSVPRNAEERAALDEALAQLRTADHLLEIVPTPLAYHALIAALACQLDEAEATLSRADNASRETWMATQEIALRRGRIEDVRAFLAQASALPEAQSDTWLPLLAQAVADPPRCAQR